MTAENEGIKEINLTELSTVSQLDFSGGFTCDFETGMCGPTDETTTEKIIVENIKETKNANNNMV